MTVLRNALCAVTVLSIGASMSACSSSGPAPVTYGADPARAARIYNSPQDIYRNQQATRQSQVASQRRAQQQSYHTAAVQPAPSRVRTGYVEPAPLHPVSAAPVRLMPVSATYDRPVTRYQAKSVAAPAKSGQQGYVEVQPGDTVYAIGRRFSVSPQAIIAENNLRAPYRLEIGQALKLPGSAPVASTTSYRQAVAPRVVQQDSVYTVQTGDTLYSISRRFGVDVQSLTARNRLNVPFQLEIGQRLLVPNARVNPGIHTSATPAPAFQLEQGPVKARDVADIARNASYTTQASKSFFEWPVRGLSLIHI